MNFLGHSRSFGFRRTQTYAIDHYSGLLSPGLYDLSTGHCAGFVPHDRVKRCKRNHQTALGKMAEWTIALVLKTRSLRGCQGSNPCLSVSVAVGNGLSEVTRRA